MQASLALPRASVSGKSLVPCRPALPSRGALQVTNTYGDIPRVGGGRKWKYLRTNDNGVVPRIKMHVKKGDMVQVIAGSDKGTTGTITRVIPKKGTVVLEGVNIKTKHIAASGEDKPGEIKKLEFPFHHSNVMHFSKEKNVRSRVGKKFLEDGRKVRYLVKTGEIID